jgi:sugar/nucleoside kinase (ribokinase family)
LLLVVGNAATADGLVRAAEVPHAHDVGILTEVAGGRAFWMPGGSASAIAVAASPYTSVRLAHPLPAVGVSESGDELRGILSAAGVDTTYCPDLADDVRALVVEVPSVGSRLMWSQPGADFVPDVEKLLMGVTHVCFAPRWGTWSERVLEAAAARGIPCSIVGEIPPMAHQWAFVVADHRQMTAASVTADVEITTAGGQGADLRSDDDEFHIDAVPINVIDTTGAGDSFGGTLLGATLSGQSLRQAGDAAAQAAANQCTRWGAIPSTNTQNERKQDDHD